MKFAKKHITNLDVNELIDGLDRFGCRKVPNQENGRDLVLKVASKEMVQKSQYVSDAWQETSMLLKSKEEMATIEGLSNLYQEVKHTNQKVLCMIQADPQNNSE